MKKIKNNYTNFILTIIAVAMIGILFKGEINKPAHAALMLQTVCVQGYKFVTNGNNGVDQIWVSTSFGNKPLEC